jgi:hypothetical protein
VGWNNDDRLLIRAIREGWKVPATRLPGVLERVVEIAAGTDPESTPRESVSATKALIAAAKLQLETIRLELKVEEHEALKRRLEALEQSPSDGNPGSTTGPARTDPPIGEPGDRGDGPGAA